MRYKVANLETDDWNVAITELKKAPKGTLAIIFPPEDLPEDIKLQNAKNVKYKRATEGWIRDEVTGEILKKYEE